MWPIWTLGAWLAEKDLFKFFSHYKSMGANDHGGMASLDHRSMVGRIYVGNHKALLHTVSSGPYGFSEEEFLRFFNYIALYKHMTPGVRPV